MDTRPGGLSFVFTDIEGSTQLLGDLQTSYGLALRLQRRIIQRCFEETGGRQMGSEGDGLFYVFPGPEAAVRAALAAQEGFEHYSTAAEFGLRVRMGIHTGPVRLSGGEYVGLTVHEVARICGAAHGGQIVCSADVCQGVTAVDDVVFRELGSFLLRGIAGPRTLYQVDRPDAVTDFPPPRDVVRAGGARVTVWRRDSQPPARRRPAVDPDLVFRGVDGQPLDERIRVDVLPGSGHEPGAFRIVVSLDGAVEEEYDGLTFGGPLDATSVVNAYSKVVRIQL